MRSAGGAADMLLDAGSDMRSERVPKDFTPSWGGRYGHHATVPVPEGGVTWGFTTAACARGDLFTVKPEVCPTPYRARATVYITWGRPCFDS